MSDRYKDFLDELMLSYEHATFTAFPDIQVLWFEENSTLFVRGSDSLIDWIYNLLAFPYPYSDVHFGWQALSNSLVDECIARDIVPTTVVGHSAGGAIAQILGYFYDCESYSLACPRTTLAGNGEFLAWADKKCVIINQEDDWIPKLPPWFIHPVEPLWLDTTDYPLFAHHLLSFE